MVSVPDYDTCLLIIHVSTIVTVRLEFQPPLVFVQGPGRESRLEFEPKLTFEIIKQLK